MNREIKFRAWDAFTGNMIATGYHVIGEVTMFGLIDQWVQERRHGIPSLEYYNHIIESQFTGLTDKNGKDAYEGDIVDTWPFYKHQGNCKGKKRYQKIIFNSGMFATENFDFGWEGEGTVRIEHCEIIGNIFENPELCTA